MIKKIKKLKDSLRMSPRNLSLLCKLGEAQSKIGSFKEAIETYNKAFKVKPDEPQIYNGLGEVVAMQGDLKGSVQWFVKSIEVKPNCEAYRMLGYVLGELCDFEPAMGCLQYVLDNETDGPKRANAALNYGNALFRNGKLLEAIPYFQDSLKHNPELSHLNLGICYFHSKQYPLALKHLTSCLSVPKARVNASLAYFMLGEYAKGYDLYETRFIDNPTLSPFNPPNLMPNNIYDLKGKTLLLYAEQGLGDTIQFFRYVKEIKTYGCKLIVAVEKNLIGLLSSYRYADEVIEFKPSISSYDYRCAMMSAPKYFGQIPAEKSYYTVDPDLIVKWGSKMPNNGKPNVGFFWRGNPRQNNSEANFTDKQRSISLNQFDAILANDQVNWICLQKDDLFNEIPSCPQLFNLMPEVRTFLDTAAIIENCDFVIGVDSSVIHLAASLGKETWMLSRFNGCWRWLMEGNGNHIYPTLTIFRQTEHSNWTPVLEEVRLALDKRTGKMHA